MKKLTKSEQLLIGLKPDCKLKLRYNNLVIYGYNGDEDVAISERHYNITFNSNYDVLHHNAVVELIKHHGVRNWSESHEQNQNS